MLRPLLIVLFSLGMLIGDARAAEFGFSVDARNKLYITFDGEIKRGDAARFKQFLMRERYNFLYASGLIINSTGGDLDEALKISELIENAGLRVDVADEGLCASSCFLIYVSAPIRLSTAPVIIHRPFYDMTEVGGADGPSYERAYRNSFARTREYLSERLVPGYLIDKMMTKGSQQGYTLSARDILAVGVTSPAVSEYQVQVCQMPTDRLATSLEVDSVNLCIDQYLFQARLRLLFGNDYLSAGEHFQLLNNYLNSLRNADPLYRSKSTDFLPSVKRIVDTQPSQEWLSLAKVAYSDAS